MVEQRTTDRRIASFLAVATLGAAIVLFFGWIAAPETAATRTGTDTGRDRPAGPPATAAGTRATQAPQPASAGAGEQLVLDRGNVRVFTATECIEGECTEKLRIDNPYADLTKDQLMALAVADATAAYAVAIQTYENAKTPEDVHIAVDYAMRGIALAPAGDVAWMYNAFIENFHFIIGENDQLGDSHLRSALIWHLAGEKLQLVESRYVENLRQQLIQRGISLEGLDEAATEFALELQGLRLRLTGEPTAANGEYL